MNSDPDTQEKCHLCGGTGILTASGICRVYLFPNKIVLILLVLSLTGSIFYSSYCFFAAGLFAVLPLANADLRLYLFPPLLTAHYAGRKINCPECNPSGPLILH